MKRDDVVLRNDYDSILEMDIFKLMDLVLKEIEGACNRRVRYEDVFEPMYVPFFQKSTFDDCVNLIQKRGKVMYFVIMAAIIREKLLLAKGFRIKNFQQALQELRKEITSAPSFICNCWV